MLHELTITVDDTLYKTLKPMVEQQTIATLLHEFIKNHVHEQPAPAITELRGTLHQIDTQDLRDEIDRQI